MRVADQCDVVVIGAGPAGSTAAQLLASWGWSVVLIHREATTPSLAESLPARRHALRHARDRGGVGMSGLAARRARADARRELSRGMGVVGSAVGDKAAVHGDGRRQPQTLA